MAKMFYNLEEALKKLGIDEAALKAAVRAGKLREFRDAGKANYKADEIDKLVKSGSLKGGDDYPEIPTEPDLSGSLGPLNLSDTGDTANPMPDLSASGAMSLSDTAGGISLSGSMLGGRSEATEIGLDAGHDSAVNLAGSGAEDIVSLDDADADRTSSGRSKDDTVVSSVGVSVFDEEDLSESADPLAKTMMTGSAAGGTGLEGVGSGSGLLDLTRESDDTSLGAELLDEIYPGEESGTLEMGEATRAGLEGMMPEATPPAQEAMGVDEDDAAPAARQAAALTVRTVTYRTDGFSHGASALMAVAIVAMCFSGLAVAAMIRGIWPRLLDFMFGKLWMFGLGTLLLAGGLAGLGIFLGKRAKA